MTGKQIVRDTVFLTPPVAMVACILFGIWMDDQLVRWLATAGVLLIVSLFTVSAFIWAHGWADDDDQGEDTSGDITF